VSLEHAEADAHPANSANPANLSSPAPAADIADALVQWQRQHGRSHLPWQNTRDPYRVWLSEVMLQQTQVSTVLGYFARFLDRFPDVAALAAAHEDEVFGLWSGLGYYSRARNMHRCAQEVVARFGGVFPDTAAQLMTLPGIGRSTGAAIAAFCFGERVAILDGNVKRVLTRLLGDARDLSVAANERALWQVATELLPSAADPGAIATYTQAVMDLGATVCTPRKPACEACPMSSRCIARHEGAPERYPVKTRKLRRTAESLWLLLVRNAAGQTWLTKRPATGIWAGLYSPPCFTSREALDAALAEGLDVVEESAFVHVLTHKDLHIHPLRVAWRGSADVDGNGGWYGAGDWSVLGLPAPVRKLLA